MITVTVGVNGGSSRCREVAVVLDSDNSDGVEQLMEQFAAQVLGIPATSWVQVYTDDGVYQGLSVWEKKGGVWDYEHF